MGVDFKLSSHFIVVLTNNKTSTTEVHVRTACPHIVVLASTTNRFQDCASFETTFLGGVMMLSAHLKVFEFWSR